VARVCNRTEQVIRLWEREQRIPKPSVKGGHRYYTQHQIDMLVEFAELMDEVRYMRSDPETRDAALKAKTAQMFANWNPTN
jgi:DNA-binding transcriptional MerR regulator